MKAEVKPCYFKFHRVFSTKKHVNGTVLQSKWSDKAGNYIYEVALDNGEKVWGTKWTLTPEKEIVWYIGSHPYHTELKQDCEVLDIKGFNSVYMDWVVEVRLSNGEIIRTPQITLSRKKTISSNQFVNAEITEEWLKTNGFKPVAERNDERTKPTVKLRRLAIKNDCVDEKNIFQSHDDLCIDIAPNPIKGDWFVWLHQEDPYRFVHVRQFRYQKDLIHLYEALTGGEFSTRES